MDYQKIRNKIAEGKIIVEKYKDETPQPVLEVCYSMFEINELLVNKLEELDNKISKNSRNSSRPPSKDDDFAGKNKSSREKSGKKPGGQGGHSGSTLRAVETPSKIIKHDLSGNCKCGKDLKKLNAVAHSKRQVFDVEVLNVVTEHQVFEATCSCGIKHCSKYPEGVNAHVQYGSSVRGLVGYFAKYQMIPSERLEELMSDIFKVSLSEGTIDNISNYATEALNEYSLKAEKHVPEMKVGNVDETPVKVAGKMGYFHVLSNEAFSFLYFNFSRGMKAVKEQGFLEKFKGVLVHDCFSMYFRYGNKHAVCNAHLLRELTFIEEKYQHKWAHRVKIFLYDLNELKKYYIENKIAHMDSLEQEQLIKNFYDLLMEGRQECAPLIAAVKNKGSRRGKQHPALNLVNRMLKLRGEILKFISDFDVPFTNNQAERDLRMLKVHQKITGGFRSEKGARVFANFRSYIGTAKKHGISVFEAMKNLYNPLGNQCLERFFRPVLPIGPE
jgi:transposase